MGQKTNSNIFRLGHANNEWNSAYFEKNNEEFNYYSYKNLQIQNYLEEFFSKHGLIIQTSNIKINQNSLSIYVSYSCTKKSLFLIKKTNNNLLLKKKLKKTFLNKKKKRNAERNNKLKLTNFTTKTKNLTNKAQLKIKRLFLIKKYKKTLQKKKIFNNKQITQNNFLSNLTKSLNVYTQKKLNIFITLQHVNRGLSIISSKKEQNLLKKKLMLLKRYSKNAFFKEALNIVLITIKTKNSAKLLANFIAKHFSYLKRHNYFLIFLKQILTIFITTKFSKIYGIKIAINGRLNHAPRAKNKLILIGNIPIQSISKPVSYSQSTSYTKNGTFGIKVWIN